MPRSRLENNDKGLAGPLAVRPKDAARLLGISERLLWTWTRSEGVPHFRIGEVVLYPVGALKDWLAMRASGAFAGAGDSQQPAGETCTRAVRDWSPLKEPHHGNPDAN
jgi:hypothetical protein